MIETPPRQSGSVGAPMTGRATSRRWSRGARGLCAGARVMRGPDWKWRDQDGPHPAMGTVTSDLHNGWVDVRYGLFYTYSKYLCASQTYAVF